MYFIVEKPGELIEKFDGWQAFYNWAYQYLDDEIYQAFYAMEKFERRGYADHIEWFKDLSLADTRDVLNDYGYNFFRI